ncbi:MAG: WD40 repeat domain-containing protein, partial [Candidatus Binatia bacterium]
MSKLDYVDYAVHCILFAAGGNVICAPDLDQQICFYRIEDGQILQRFPTGDARVFALGLSRDERLLAAGSSDGTVRVFDTSSGEMLFADRRHNMTVWSVEFDPTSDRLISAGRDNRVTARGAT